MMIASGGLALIDLLRQTGKKKVSALDNAIRAAAQSVHTKKREALSSSSASWIGARRNAPSVQLDSCAYNITKPLKSNVEQRLGSTKQATPKDEDTIRISSSRFSLEHPSTCQFLGKPAIEIRSNDDLHGPHEHQAITCDALGDTYDGSSHSLTYTWSHSSGSSHASDPPPTRGRCVLLYINEPRRIARALLQPRGPEEPRGMGDYSFKERANPRERHLRYIDKTASVNPRPDLTIPTSSCLSSHHGMDLPRPEGVPSIKWKDVLAIQQNFWVFLDEQLHKIEAFYSVKEHEAISTLEMLKLQLRASRHHRRHEMNAAQEDALAFKGEKPRHDGTEGQVYANEKGGIGNASKTNQVESPSPFHDRFKKHVHFSSNLEAPTQEFSPTQLRSCECEYWLQDWNHPSYAKAKLKLKQALQEYHQGLELLNSYALLNRTAFRKINKKYDKVAGSGKRLVYMMNIEKAQFITSSVVDDCLRAVQDLYTRQFCGGDRGYATVELRRKPAADSKPSRSAFLNGLALGTGLAFSIDALRRAARRIHADSPDSRDNNLAMTTNYLLQLYAGFFLPLLLTLLLCVDYRIFQRARVNYIKIFKLDVGHHLEWTQLAMVSHYGNPDAQASTDFEVPMCFDVVDGLDYVAQLQLRWW